LKTYFIILLVACLLVSCGSGGSSKNLGSASSATTSSVVTNSSASSSASPAVSHWQLVWNDEFDGGSLDASKWRYEQSCLASGTELQCYTNRPENVSVSDGKLHIAARKEKFTGPLWSNENEKITQDYTSGRIDSITGKWTYGRIEVNAKMPQGKGIVPAIWLLPVVQGQSKNGKYGEWPASGEIDILESFFPNSDGNGTNDIHGTLIYGEASPGTRAATGTAYTPTNKIWENYHVYALEWEEGEMRWYFDDVHYATQTKDGWFTLYGPQGEKKISAQAEPFDQNFFLILNVSILALPDTANFPQEMTVDYVRVYHCDLDAVTGKGCATNINKNIQPSNETPKKSFLLFANGAKNLGLSIDNTTVTTKTVTKSDTDVISNPALTDGNNIVWDLQFYQWPRRAYLNWENPSNISGLTQIFNLASMSTLGEIKFDIYVDAMDDATILKVKLDSGGANASYYPLKDLKKGVWQSVEIPLVNLLPNRNPAGAVHYGSVVNPFVIEADSGTAHIRLNNIRLSCIGLNCEISPVISGKTLNENFSVFSDEINPIWNRGLNVYDDVTNSKHTQINIVDDLAENRGKVLDITWNDTAQQNGLVYAESTDAKDASAFIAGGYISFDIKVLSYGKNTNGFVYQVWCGLPCGDQGAVPAVPDDGQWHTITLPLLPFVNYGVNLKKLTNPFVFHPVWGDQQGVHVQLDNIKWILP
jgi:beta-glucanase (GH16 family)